jgi:hypothetical protein
MGLSCASDGPPSNCEYSLLETASGIDGLRDRRPPGQTHPSQVRPWHVNPSLAASRRAVGLPPGCTFEVPQQVDPQWPNYARFEGVDALAPAVDAQRYSERHRCPAIFRTAPWPCIRPRREAILHLPNRHLPFPYLGKQEARYVPKPIAHARWTLKTIRRAKASLSLCATKKSPLW